MKKIILVAVGVFALTGCYKSTVSLDGSPLPNRAPDFTRWHHHFIGGLINGSPELQPNDMCPNGASVVQTMTRWYQPLIAGITYSIYTPTTDKVWCKQGASLTPMGGEAVDGDVVAAVELVQQDAQGAALGALNP